MKIDGKDKESKSGSGYTDAELDAMRSVKALLLEQGVSEDNIRPMELAYTVLTCKLRPQESVDKYKLFLSMLETFGIKTLDECWGAANRDGSGDWKEHYDTFGSYAATGRDAKGRSIMWIRGKKEGTPKDKEVRTIKSSVLFVLAIHADLTTLREGVSFVIDTTNNSSNHGNEGKMQKAWQSYPLRPQAIYIVGANMLKRVVINGLISLASLFTKSKVLARIQFADMKFVKTQFPKESLPKYAGGEAGGIKDINEWVQQRITDFPIPEL